MLLIQSIPWKQSCLYHKVLTANVLKENSDSLICGMSKPSVLKTVKVVEQEIQSGGFQYCSDFHIIIVIFKLHIAQAGNCILISNFIYQYVLPNGWLGVSCGARVHRKVLWNLDIFNSIIQTGNEFVGRKCGFITGAQYKISTKLHMPRKRTALLFLSNWRIEFPSIFNIQ